jgi:hypothetical protein
MELASFGSPMLIKSILWSNRLDSLLVYGGYDDFSLGSRERVRILCQLIYVW